MGPSRQMARRSGQTRFTNGKAGQERRSRFAMNGLRHGNDDRTNEGGGKMLNRLIPLMLGMMLVAGCSSSPTTPTPLEPPPGAYRSTFTFLRGDGRFGGISVTPKSTPEG